MKTDEWVTAELNKIKRSTPPGLPEPSSKEIVKELIRMHAKDYVPPGLVITPAAANLLSTLYDFYMSSDETSKNFATQFMRFSQADIDNFIGEAPVFIQKRNRK